MDETTRRWSWDYALMMATVAVLAALGVQSFAGTLYAWWAYRAVPGWESSGYPAYVETMNAIAGPLVVALVLLLGLCVPKRVLSRKWLWWASAAMVAAGVGAGLSVARVADGLAVFLFVAILFQAVVLALTVSGRRPLSYLTEGHLVRIGSGLLHMGFLVFAYVVVALQASAWMLPVFWVGAGCLAAGSTLSFYAGPLSRTARPAD